MQFFPSSQLAGLLSRLVNPHEDLLPAAKEFAKTMARWPQPALHVTKAALRKGLETTFAEALSLEVGIARKSATNPFNETMRLENAASSKFARITQKNKKPGQSKL